ncbi:hypothetical protein [Chondromyces crocatus]|uniref:Uncharacterized protein n=1 Tax=Chondromyces crocatus TaxID=52 RepID=A0A0K1E5E7_CHOCO|nr:hypothetical protein [Chondromyces crocatus]AKT36096.1 uncharacterized protein CMC5_002090 [Chondromyces crocatus]
MVSCDGVCGWRLLERILVLGTTAQIGFLFGAVMGVTGCAAQGSTWGGDEGRGVPPEEETWRQVVTACGATAEMPAPLRERVTPDGRMLARISWARGHEGSRYEIACFDLPERLSGEHRPALVAQVEQWISARPGSRLTERRRVRVGNVEASEIRLAFPGEQAGQYWIFVEGERRLFEVSVVGPQGKAHAAGVERFFRSFRLHARGADE